MKRTLLLAATLALASGSVFAQQPEPSFKDYVDLPKQVVTSERTNDNDFPKSSYVNAGGPKGPATVLTQSVDTTEVLQAIGPRPSFNG